MSIYESNIAFLNKHYPALLRAINDSNESEPPYEVVMTRNNESNLLITLNDKSYYLHSRYSARQEARKWVQTIRGKLADCKHLLITGIGLGYFLEELLAVTTANDVFIYEPNAQVFNEWLHVKDISVPLTDPRIRLVAVGNDEFLPLQIANIIAEQLSGPIEHVSPPIYEILYRNNIREVESKIKDMVVHQMSNIETHQKYQGTWITNILYNIPHMIMNSSIADLKDLWKGQGVRAIVVGSGPSLREDIHYLKQLKDKCLIIAAGSSIQAMEHFGVYPHFVVSMDGSEKNYDVFKNIDVSQVPLVFCPPVYYEITDNYKQSLYHAKFESDLITKHIIDTDDNVPTFISTSTVTGTAIQIAAYMGISEVILMGQDLSYPDDQYYAPGVNHVSEDEKDNQISLSNEWVVNVEGGYNRTRPSMQVLLKDTQILVQIMKLRDVRIINTSKKGAVIEGTDWISMDDLAPQLLQSQSRQFNISHYITPPSLEMQKKKLSETNVKLKQVLKEIEKMDTKLIQLLEWMKKLDKGLSIRNLTKVNQSLSEINTLWQWATTQDIFKNFYNYTLAHYINLYMRHVSEIAETTNPFHKAKLITQHLGNLVNRMREFTPEMKRIVGNSIEHLNTLVAAKIENTEQTPLS